MQQLYFITSNEKKAEQLRRYLQFPVLHKSLDLEEIQSLDVEKIALHKARAAYEIIKAPVLVEDTAISFIALNGLPGPLIKWFFDALGNVGLCELLSGKADRAAVAKSCFVLIDEYGEHIFTGERAGSIATTPTGPTDFGWNPIFIPAGASKTWAQMDWEEQSKTSMRRLALEKLQVYLDTYQS